MDVTLTYSMQISKNKISQLSALPSRLENLDFKINPSAGDIVFVPTLKNLDFSGLSLSNIPEKVSS